MLFTPKLWNFQRVLHTLAATQEFRRHTRLHSRGSTRVPPTSRGATFPPPSSRGRILSLRARERIPGVPVATQEEALSAGKTRGTPGSCHQSQRPQISQSIPGKPVFPALPRLSSRGSTHTTVARGTALWESLVGKPPGKASWESHRSLDPREGKGDTAATAREESARACPQSTRTDSPGETPEVPQDPCQHWRGILRFRHRLHTRSYAPASKGEESREAPEQLAWGLAFTEASRAGPCGPRRKSRAPAATRENPGGFPLQAR